MMPRPLDYREWAAMKKRYRAAIKAVRSGADPVLALSYVIWPTPQIEEAQSGEMPRGWRLLTEDEARRRYNEETQRYHEPMQKKWAA